MTPHPRVVAGGRSPRRAWFWAGLICAVAATSAFLLTRGMGFSARMQPSTVEAAVMRWARAWATPAGVRHASNPVVNTAAVREEAMAHWADHCMPCHGNDGSGDTSLGRNVYPPAPDMRQARTQQMSDGALFYVIEQGIPFTAMPAWGNGTADGIRQSWELVHFIRHLPDLTPQETARMETLNPTSAAHAAQEKHIDDFLNGKDD